MQTSKRQSFRRLNLRRLDAGMYSGAGYTLLRVRAGFWHVEVAAYPLNGLQRQERLPGAWPFRVAQRKAREHATQARARAERQASSFGRLEYVRSNYDRCVFGPAPERLDPDGLPE